MVTEANGGSPLGESERCTGSWVLEKCRCGSSTYDCFPGMRSMSQESCIGKLSITLRQ